MAVMLSAPMTNFPIQKGFVISCTINIKRPVDKEATKPANKEKTRLVDAEDKIVVDGEEIRPVNIEELIDTEILADIEDLIVIGYIDQYWYKQTAHYFMI